MTTLNTAEPKVLPSREAFRQADRNPRRASRANVWIYSILMLGSLAFLTPFYFVLNGSLKTDEAVQRGDFVAPVTTPQWSNYREAVMRLGFRTEGLTVPSFPALSNTIVITTLTIAGQILSCSLVGFGFARFKFRGRGTLFILMISTMMLPSQVTMIPLFVGFKTLNLIDTIWPLVLPAFFASPFFVFMFRQFFSQIPEELIEAARMDGASNWRIYWQFMLPLSGPVIAIVAIYTFLGAWNDFLGPLIYLNSDENRTLALALNSFKGQYGLTDAHLLMAASVVCMVPCVLLFFAAQKYFVESVASSSIK
ncbi:MAG TPA: carbohydrate ABC transporter permease [Tepidisphaeraceae bacterium]|jgi:ABC-type glycerol-3-phosphate transport system permease component